MPPEELARIESAVETEEELTEEELDEIGQVSEQLALHSIESEHRHEQILEQIEVNHQCLLKLEASLPTQTENPVTQAAVTELSTLKTELAEMKGMLVALQTSLTALLASNRHTNESPETTPEIPVENPLDEPKPEKLTDEPKLEETKRKHKVI